LGHFSFFFLYFISHYYQRSDTCSNWHHTLLLQLLIVAYSAIPALAETAILPATTPTGGARRTDAAKPAPAITVPATPVKMRRFLLFLAMISNCSFSFSYYSGSRKFYVTY
jgi:hypothetical protein